MNTYLGPYGKVKLQVGDNVSKTRQMVLWNMAYLTNDGSSNIPSDDKAHYDNYRIRTKEMKSLEHTYNYTYNPSYNVFGLALILDINYMRFRTKILIPGIEYTYQDYQYLMDVRYLHNDCRYIVWVVDGNNELIIRKSVNTFLLNQRPGESDAEYIERIQFLNEEDVKLPDYATYRFNLDVIEEASGSSKYYNEVSNMDMIGEMVEINITNRPGHKGNSFTINTENISKDNTARNIPARSLLIYIEHYPLQHTFVLAIRSVYNALNGSRPPNGANRYYIINSLYSNLIEYSNSDEIEIEAFVYDSQGTIVLQGTGHHEQSNINYFYSVRDSNFSIKLNN